jgi:hypothetical protein
MVGFKIMLKRVLGNLFQLLCPKTIRKPGSTATFCRTEMPDWPAAEEELFATMKKLP